MTSVMPILLYFYGSIDMSNRKAEVKTFNFDQVVVFLGHEELKSVCCGQVDVRLSVGTSVTHRHVLLVH